MVSYDIHHEIKKLKRKTYIAISTIGLVLGSGGLSLAVFGTANALTPVWVTTGNYQINVEYLGVNYPETLNLVQSGITIISGNLNTNPPAAGSAFTVTSGSVSGNTVDFSAKQDTSTLVVRFSGTIAPTGSMSGSWNDVTPGNRVGTWSTTSGTATAPSINDFNADKNLRPSQCSLTRSSKEVVDVSFRLINDYDSGVHGNAWANDTIHRDLNIWNVSGNTYCAIISDNGNIVTFAGDSPNGTGTVGGGVKGQMDGGYRTTLFSGTFLGSSSPYSKHGNLGTYDLMCSDANNCPGAHPSYSSYFSSTAGNDLAWWGWQYNTCKNGDWVNSINANIGDITGSASKHQSRCFDDNERQHHDNDINHYKNGDSDNHKTLGPRG